jgi:hypothetical protein
MPLIEGKPPKPEPTNEIDSTRVQNGIDNRSYIGSNMNIAADTVNMQQLSGRTSNKNYY